MLEIHVEGEGMLKHLETLANYQNISPSYFVKSRCGFFSGISQWNGVLVNILVSPAGLSLKHSINFIISVSTGQGWKKTSLY